MMNKTLADTGMLPLIHTTRQLLIGLLVCLYSDNLAAFDHQHQQFDALLQEIVIVNGHQSSVDYARLKKAPGQLTDYLAGISAIDRDEFSAWSVNQQKAFLINAYNAFTIQLILSAYPDLASIKDLGSFFSSPWKQRFFSLWGEPQHLDYIEHDVLRRNYADPRLHFVLVCASISCPPLSRHAYSAEQLEQQMNHATENFIRDKQRNHFDTETGTLYLSPLFKWYREDFGAQTDDVKRFVARWISDDPLIVRQISNTDIAIRFNDYDWSLNDRSHK